MGPKLQESASARSPNLRETESCFIEGCSEPPKSSSQAKIVRPKPKPYILARPKPSELTIRRRLI